VIVIDTTAVAVWAVGVAESVTFTAKLKVPAVVGVPEITPPALRVPSPGGRAPDVIAQV
jgi:hypothetical protein